MSPSIAAASAVVGLLLGLTGASGGALMTPMLILLFSVRPTVAIASDLVATLMLRPVGALVHLRRGTVDLRLVGWLSAGSAPAAFAGSFLLHRLGRAGSGDVELALGAVLLAGGAAMVLRRLLDRPGRRRPGHPPEPAGLRDVAIRPWPTLAIGAVGGLVVGATSVGAGSLMVVLLLLAYPTLSASRLVGTDLAQAIPLTASAAIGALVFGHVAWPLVASIVVGGVPGVLAGALACSRVSDRHLRPALTVVVVALGLRYVGVDAVALASLAAAALAGGGLWWLSQRWARPATTAPGVAPGRAPGS